ncbi:Rid family hydrolase [Sphaerotilus sp.]|uniref:chorismate transformation enzyme, FkbO/Hyg5 family n=1 Tax=Sphaerotilus sp. TaxID=2093942 RepID=UPI00286D85CB|nr:Rid family hydrolase [Sphaerotilus sp.]
MSLLFERRTHHADLPRAAGVHVLGQRHLFPGAGAGAGGLPPLLRPAQTVTERWISTHPVRTGETGLIRHSDDGLWLYGEASLPVPATGTALQAMTHQLYADLFRTLHAHGGRHLLKLWNYLPRLNAALDGLEVYRHFNIGRQQAFLDAGAAAFDGAPAACALGTAGGPMTLAFLAGPQAPRPVENPRQTSAYHYPATYGPRSPTFSRAALVTLAPGHEMLFVSGTASIVGHASVHPGDVVQQTEETLRNLRAVLDAAHDQTPARFALAQCAHTVYVRHAADLDAVRTVFAQAVGADSPAARGAVYLQADVCRSELLVEIECHGDAPR